MLGLTGLLSPLLIAGGVLMGVVIADTQEVYIREIGVPASMTRAGYTPAVVDERIRGNLLALERAARTRPETRQLATEAAAGPLDLLAQYLNITLLARAVQSSSDLIEYTVAGEIVELGNNYTIRLRITHRAGFRILSSITRPTEQVEALLRDASAAILRAIDPHIYCSILLREAIVDFANDSATQRRALANVQACAVTALPNSTMGDRVWLLNLLGIALYLQEDQAGATRALGAALRINPDFSPALFNLGVMFAQNRRHEEAIRAFQTVFRRVSAGESPQTYAAAYSEWGDSLVALGRIAEARQRYADAVRQDPRFALAYFRWADTLPPGPEADRLRQTGGRIDRAVDQIYTENLVGLLRRPPPAP